MRRQLDEQIRLVEEGKTPLNVFTESPEIIPSVTPEAAPPNAKQTLRYRAFYHRGYGSDDVDRYGPAFELVKELHRRIEEADAVVA